MKKDRRTYIIDIRKLLRINMDKDMLINNGETTGKRRFNGRRRKGSMIREKRILI